jgi:hypothetical protein
MGGWLLVLCAWLLVGQPIGLAFVAASSLTALPLRGLPMALVLFARLLVTAIGVAAGLAVVGRRGGAIALAKWSLVLSAATDVFVYTTPFFPSNRLPGDTLPLIVASLAFYTIWIVYLFRSKRVRNTFPV